MGIVRLANITVGTRNKEQVGKHRIFPYCESITCLKLNFFKHQHSVIASPYSALIASSDCTSQLNKAILT